MLADAQVFHNEEDAYKYLEAHVWTHGPECPRCRSRHVGKLNGESTRIGTYKCYDCCKPFTVKIGTVFERSHLPLHVWMKAIFLISTSRKDIRARELSDLLEVTPKSAASVIARIDPIKHRSFSEQL
jgi:transposase-like protein